jgi:hypothetical protein
VGIAAEVKSAGGDALRYPLELGDECQREVVRYTTDSDKRHIEVSPCPAPLRAVQHTKYGGDVHASI